MAERSSIFDMIGPVMIGPSSSHTAGVVRIGLMCHHLLGRKPDEVVVTFYNSFATTYEGHGSDRAVLAGLMGFSTEDTRIRDALQIANEQHLLYMFKSIGSAPRLHPNTLRIEASYKNDENTNNKTEHSVNIVGVSRGGGLISITEVNGFQANLSGVPYTLFILAGDVKGSIAYITNVVRHDDCNIATMTVSRTGKDRDAGIIMELDSGLRQSTLAYLKTLSWVKEVIYIGNITI